MVCKSVTIVDTSEVCGGRGKGEMCAGPGEQAQGFETAEGGPQMLPPYPTDEPVEFLRCIVWDLSRPSWQRRATISWAANQTRKSMSWMRRVRYAHQSEAELLDGEKTKPTVRAFVPCSFG